MVNFRLLFFEVFNSNFHILKVPSQMNLKIIMYSVILLPAHPASCAHNFVSGMQSFYFSESQDAMVLQICH